MKKLMFAISLAGLLGLGASAAVQSANTFGVLKVDSTNSETVVCVPWVNVGTGDGIVASNLVMTANLTENDTLAYYKAADQKYEVWTLDANKNWSSPKMVTTIGATDATDSASQTKLPRGGALILKRQIPFDIVNDAVVGRPIYLYGQYTDAVFSGQTLTRSATANVWNLIAYPNTTSTAWDLNTGVTWENVIPGDSGDSILLQSQAGYVLTLKYINGAWGIKIPGGNVDTASAKVQPGCGVWYVSAKGDAGNPPSYSVSSN